MPGTEQASTHSYSLNEQTKEYEKARSRAVQGPCEVKGAVGEEKLLKGFE